MRLLHTSDWHLGMTFRGGFSYADDQRHFIDQICEIAKEEKVDGILLAGDVFDKSIASQEGLAIYNDSMTRICGEMKIPVYLIAGNHDGAERISQCYELLKNSGLYIAGSLTADVQAVNVNDVDIYMLPWISTDKVKTIYPDEAGNIDSMEDAYRVVLDKYREHFVEGHKNILIAHAFIVDSDTSVSDRAAEVGRATMVSSSVFDGFDYVALGHLHGPQYVNDRIRYSGSPMAYSFGKEEKQVKSVTIIDTDDMSKTVVPIKQLHKRITLEGTYEELLKGDFGEDILKGYVRLDVNDIYVGSALYAALSEKYYNLLEVGSREFEQSDSKRTMTIEELESSSLDMETVFVNYCKDVEGFEASEHLRKLFEDAAGLYEKGVVCDEADQS